MKNINIDNGLRRFTVNNDSNKIIEFNAGDPNILKRMDTAVEMINKKADEIGEVQLHFDGSPLESTSEVIKLIDDFNKVITDQINYVFMGNVCEVLFGGQSPLSMVGGMHLWERVLLTIVPVIKEEVTSQLKTRNAKIQKYTKLVKNK